MADRSTTPVPEVKDRDEVGEITTTTKDLRPFNPVKERRLEMQRLFQFFAAIERGQLCCATCGSLQIERKP